MDELLVPFKTTTANFSRGWNDEEHLLQTKQVSSIKDHRDISSPEQALKVLRAHPQQEDLFNVLKWLCSRNDSNIDFDINGQTSQAAQIIHALVNDVLPDHWSRLHNHPTGKTGKMRNRIISILTNVSGISMITSRLRVLLDWEKTPDKTSQNREAGQSQALQDSLDLLESVLESENVIHSIWSRFCNSPSLNDRKWLLWKELVNLLGNGKVLSICAEADDNLAKSSGILRGRSWLSDGSKFCSWLGLNLHHMLPHSEEDANCSVRAWAQMLQRALTLGHVDQIIHAAYDGFVNGTGNIVTYLQFTTSIKGSSRKVIIYSLLRCLDETHLRCPDVRPYDEGSHSKIGSIGALLYRFLEHDGDTADRLLEWLSSDGVVQGLQIRRAVLTALAKDFSILEKAISDTLRTFGDKLYIKHTPVLHQEGVTENLLLLLGYAHQKNSRHVAEISQSGVYLNAISNRLAASSHRASVLGMYVGTAVSELVDPPDKRLNFGSEEMTSSRGQRYLHLTKMQDPLGSIEGLKPVELTSNLAVRQFKHPAAVQKVDVKPSNGHASTESKIVSIEEIDNESDSDDEDLPIYAKPDSDLSDSDEDPTLIERSKPTAPVYINDLISGLRDDENHDRHLLALNNASPLIRRKAAFGSEVSDNVEELASILTGLGDKWDLENFQELRLQGMIAVLIAQPLEMGQWFSRAYFNGEFSIQQRAAILTTLGLGARELAGFGNEDMALSKSNQLSSSKEAPSLFPSKRLPPKLHALYADSTSSSEIGSNAIGATSRIVEKSILQPMALQARESLSGPSALKVRTFSSRMEVEKRRTKPIPNALAKVVADGFFFPLIGRWSVHVQGYAKSNSPLLTHPLLPLFLKTLSLILHAAGPSTLPLPIMTTEFLSLLLGLRSLSTGTLPTTEALLFSFLTVLELNRASDQGRRLAAENGKALLEMGEWVEGVLGNVRGDGEEEGRVRALAAGCVGRVREVVEREERVLVGELIGMM